MATTANAGIFGAVIAPYSKMGSTKLVRKRSAAISFDAARPMTHSKFGYDYLVGGSLG